METFDTVIVGGGPAGLSAALALGRSRRDVLVLDDGTYRNAPAHEAHNILTRDGTPPGEIRRLAREEMGAYPGVRFRSGRVASVTGEDGDFTLTLDHGGAIHGRTLILATGVRDELPVVPGMAELWGSAIHHCPYCHGWEIRDRRLGLYAAGERAPMLAGHLAPLLRNLTADLVLLTDGPAALDAEARAALDRIGVPLDERRIERLERDGDTLRAVVFTDGSRLDRDALFAAPTPHPRTALGESLGCAVIAPGDGMLPGLFRVDMLYQTSVAGVWAVGDVAVPAANVPLAIASGTMAGAAANLHLAKAGVFAASPVAA